MISLIFLLLAAICNAIMDICAHKFNSSIFTKHPKKIKKASWYRWWNGYYSWRNKYNNDDPYYGRRKLWNTEINYPVQFTDSWHLFKMLMIIFIVLSIITYNGFLYVFLKSLQLPLLRWIELSIYGTIWNVTFSLFYHKILKK
jgi:hypothetical protein